MVMSSARQNGESTYQSTRMSLFTKDRSKEPMARENETDARTAGYVPRWAPLEQKGDPRASRAEADVLVPGTPCVPEATHTAVPEYPAGVGVGGHSAEQAGASGPSTFQGWAIDPISGAVRTAPSRFIRPRRTRFREASMPHLSRGSNRISGCRICLH